MNKVIFAAGALFIAATVSTAPKIRRAAEYTAWRVSARLAKASRASAVAPKQVANAAEDGRITVATNLDVPGNYQQMVTTCVIGCHNTRNPLPAGAPFALDKANFGDPGADAATWERVVKAKVGAMPAGIANTRRGGARQVPVSTAHRQPRRRGRKKESTWQLRPAPFEPHRYANAVRDLLGVTVDVADLLPSDSGDFGFDNIASALPTSPLLLERYLTAACGSPSLRLAIPRPSRAPTPTPSAPLSRRRSTSRSAARHTRRHDGAPHVPGRRRSTSSQTTAEDGRRGTCWCRRP